MSEKYILNRTGSMPIRFNGKKVAEAAAMNKDNHRGWRISLYENADFIAWHVQFETNWRGEQPYAWAGVVKRRNLVSYALRSFNPIPYHVGFPPGEKYAKKQVEFLREYRTLYVRIVTEALKQAGYTVDFPAEVDPESVIWQNLADLPDTGVPCAIKFSSGLCVEATCLESQRAPGQLSWDIGSTLAYDTPEIVAWGYLDE